MAESESESLKSFSTAFSQSQLELEEIPLKQIKGQDASPTSSGSTSCNALSSNPDLGDIKRTQDAIPSSTFSVSTSSDVLSAQELELKKEQDLDLESANRDGDEDGDGDGDTNTVAQAGVVNMEAVSRTWTRWGLGAAYASIFLMAFAVSLEGQVVQSVSIFATSSFDAHGLISTVCVVQGVINAVIKTPIAKLADVFGRLEAFTISIILYTLGYIQMSLSHSVSTFSSAQIFYSAGSTGLQILQQIFIADTSDLLNRALWSSLPEVPFLVTVWIGSMIGNEILGTLGWRWGYGIWCVVLPVTFIPLALTLFLNNRKAKKLSLTVPSPFANQSPIQILKTLWNEVDIGGIVLLSAAFALVLIPLTIASKAEKGWGSPSIIVMLVLGVVSLIIFPIWESNKKLAPRPLIPLYLMKSRTFCAGCGVGFFYFMVFYLSVQPYFYSYLLVVQNKSVTSAGHITQTFSFTSTVTAILISFVIKYTKYYKPFVILGSLLYLLGLGLMLKLRTQSSSTLVLISTQILLGVGGGMLNVQAQLGVQASTSHSNVAVATAVYLTCVEIGGAVGSAISGVIWSKNIPCKLLKYLPKKEGKEELVKGIYNSIDVALSYGVGSPEREAINQAYQETMQILLICALALAVPALVLGFFMENYRLDDREQGVKGIVIGGKVGEENVEGEGK